MSRPLNPLFSIIIPAFNRGRFLARCIDSVTNQSFLDWEIIIVDDGSTDDTSDRLRAYTRPNIISLTLKKNRGVCPARNAGVAEARGRWLVFLDSDDELFSTSTLIEMAAAVENAGGADALWFRCQRDDGSLSPDPMPRHDVSDYKGYLAFLEESHGRSRDMIRCVRRECFETVRYPDNRMLEDKFHLDFALRFRSRFFSTVARRYHQDAPNQLVKQLARLDPIADVELIRDRAIGLSSLLDTHGCALRRHAPRVYQLYLERAVKQSVLAGARGPLAKLTFACMKTAPGLTSAKLTVLAAIAMILGRALPRIVALGTSISRVNQDRFTAKNGSP